MAANVLQLTGATAAFWIAFWLITPLVLRLAGQASHPRAQKILRVVTAVGQVAALVLLFFPWSLDGRSALALIAQGHAPIIAFAIGLLLALVLNTTARRRLVWIGALVQVALSIAFIPLLVLIQGIQVTNPPFAPMVLVLHLLVMNAIVLVRIHGLTLVKTKWPSVAVWTVLTIAALLGLAFSTIWLPAGLPAKVSSTASYGTITGSVSYPSEAFPDGLTVCAEHATTHEVTCTDPLNTDHPSASKGFIEGRQFTYGLGYELRLRQGSYTVYATAPQLAGYRAYHTELVECSITTKDAACEQRGHEPITVYVTAGSTSYAHPQDWYAP